MGINFILKHFIKMKVPSIILFLSCMLFSGCYKSYISKRIVHNTSSHYIKVIMHSYTSNSKDSLIINPKSEAIVESFGASEGGPAYNTVEGCATFITWYFTLKVNNDASLKVAKDITDSKNWKYTHNAGFQKVDVECRLVITDADIAPK